VAPAVISELGMTEVSDLDRVESALAELRGGDHRGSVRATTLNLVVLCESDTHVERAQDAISRIGGSRPLRAIVLLPGEGHPKVAVSSSCWAAADGEVCSEQVLIAAARDALPSAVVPLLLSDLPAFVWWQGEIDMGDEVLVELVELSDRLIVDSDEAGIDAVEKITLLPRALSDLAWGRTAPWREAVAGMFDTAGPLECLEHLIGAEVSGPQAQASLIAGWLRSRLHRQVGLDLTERSSLNRVSLDCGGSGCFTVERDGRLAVGTAEGPGLPAHPVVLRHDHIASLVGGEIYRMGVDHVYEQALAAAHGEP
jgi:glucose-6-phosphate dehydrogenase assembly protein OpcA